MRYKYLQRIMTFRLIKTKIKDKFVSLSKLLKINLWKKSLAKEVAKLGKNNRLAQELKKEIQKLIIIQVKRLSKMQIVIMPEKDRLEEILKSPA